MKYDRPVRDLMIECVRSLHEPFTRESVIEWFRQHYPDVKTSTVGAHMAGLTVGRNPDSFPHLSRFPAIIERVGRGLYQRAGKGSPLPISARPSRSWAGWIPSATKAASFSSICATARASLR